MVKSELITKIASKFEQLSACDIEAGINKILECIGDALTKGDRVEIRGFGSFELRHRLPRNAHNPRTGEKLVTISKYAPHFKPGKEFRNRINESRVKNITIKA